MGWVLLGALVGLAVGLWAARSESEQWEYAGRFWTGVGIVGVSTLIGAGVDLQTAGDRACQAAAGSSTIPGTVNPLRQAFQSQCSGVQDFWTFGAGLLVVAVAAYLLTATVRHAAGSSD